MTYSKRGPFWSHVDMSAGLFECWPWVAARDPHGYGRGRFGWTSQAHRNAYALANPDFDRSLHVCHSCDNPPCCNPAHLFAGTATDNMQDAGRKGRLGKARGEGHGKAKLDWTKVAVIHRMSADGYSKASIARAIGISWAAVDCVLTGRTWTRREAAA